MSATRTTHPKRRYIIAVLALFFAGFAGWNTWEWGREQNFWGTPTALQRILNERVAQPAAFGLTPVATNRTEHTQLFGKPTPYTTGYVIADSAENQAFFKIIQAAKADGWVEDDSCGDRHLWCANKNLGNQIILRMTISETKTKNEQSKGRVFTVQISYY